MFRSGKKHQFIGLTPLVLEMRVMKRIAESLLFALLLLCGIAQGATPVQVDFFYEPGFHDCEQIEAEILPDLGKRFGDTCVIQKHDIGIETNFLYLLQLEDAIGHSGPDRAYLIVEKQHIFGPSPDREELFSAISDLLTLAPNVGQASSLSALVKHGDGGQAGSLSYFGEIDADAPLLEERYHDFTLPAVLIAGLLDGINPCAISTLVFFMSLLAVSKVKSRQLLLLGASFCLASFLFERLRLRKHLFGFDDDFFDR